MPGPNSAPNGDASLTSSKKVYCVKHKDHLDQCESTCVQLTKRAMLAQQGKLFTGKTQ
jgi:hypothetical protein